MPRRSISGSRVLITGASSGIGQALARQMYSLGAEIIVTARREERLRELVDELQADDQRAIAVAGDITDADVRARLVQTAVAELGGLNILINNAGIGAVGPFAEADEQRLRQIMEVNFFAPLELIRLALPTLGQSIRPMIVNIGSVLGHFAVPNKSEYCASKFAMHGFTDALRVELAAAGVDVLLVSPSTTDSEFFEHVIDNQQDQPPQKGPLSMSPETVARHIVRGIQRGRREIILSTSGKLTVWADRLLPDLLSWLLSRRPP